MKALIVGIVLVLAPSLAAHAQDFLCPETAIDIDACIDPADLTTCAAVTERTAPDQRILRTVDVQDGPFIGVELSALAETAAADARFAAARLDLCAVPTPPPVCPAPPPAPPSPAFSGLPWYGPDPGINVFFR